ncbi:MAG: hypothetical protein LUC43_04985, partial [Burkholderiales bacterium]|nr:hypothetical protein [Burkholderiales bacterium]
MPPAARGEKCLLTLAIAMCFNGSSVFAQTNDSVLSEDLSSIFNSIPVFKELETNDPIIFFEDLNGGTPVYTSDAGWNLSKIFKNYEKYIDASSTLNFAFIQANSGDHAFQLTDYTDDFFEFKVEPALNVWMTAIAEGFFEGNADGSTNSAFELSPNTDKSGASRLTTVEFLNQVNLNYIAEGNGSRAISIGGNQDSTNISVTFDKDLSVRGQFNGKENTLLYLGAGTSTIFDGNTTLIGESQYSVSGIYFHAMTKEETIPKLYVSGNLVISADNVLEGNGIVIVKYKETDWPRWSVLHGSLDNFTGTWNQTGGYLYVDGKINTKQQWTLSNVWLITDSENALSISFDKWDPTSEESKTQKAVFGDGILTGLTLTDPILSLDYLVEAANAYTGTQLVFKGEVYAGNNAYSYIKLNNLDNLYSITSNLVLSSVTLDLDGKSELIDKSIHIGAVKGDGSSDLTLTGTELTLYRTGIERPVTNGIPQVNVGENSTLNLLGDPAGTEASWALLESTVEINPLGTMNLDGTAHITGDITNKGALNFLSGSDVAFFSNLIQEEGKTEFKEGSDVRFHSEVQLNGGELEANGTLTVSTFKQTAGLSDFNGVATISNFELTGSKSRSAFPIATVGTGGTLTTNTLSLSSGNLIVGDGNRKAGRAFLTTDSLSIKENGSLTVSSNGVLIYGNSPSEYETITDDTTKEYYLVPSNIVNIAKQYGGDQGAILGVNKQIDLGQISGLVIGGSSIAVAAEDSISSTPSLRLGEGSTLIISRQLKDPVFTSSNGLNTVSLENGSNLLVLDAHNLGYLTDDNVQILDDYIGSNILTSSAYVDVSAVKNENGWQLVSEFDMGKAASSFLYPTIQTYLYTEYEDFNTDSANAGAQFLARADSTSFMAEGIKNKMIGQATQISRMLGTKLTAYESLNRSIKYLSSELANSVSMKAGDHAIFGGINYDFLLSKYMYSYLGGTGFRSSSQSVDFGILYGVNDSSRVGVGFSASNVWTYPRQAIFNSSNHQWNFMINAGYEKDFMPFIFGVNASYLYSKNKLKGTLPASMQMGRLTSDLPAHILSLGANVGVRPFESVTIGLKPALRYFIPETESIYIGGKKAFNSDIRSQTFVDLPIYASFKGKVGRLGNADVYLSSNLEMAARVGQRNDRWGL